MRWYGRNILGIEGLMLYRANVDDRRGVSITNNKNARADYIALPNKDGYKCWMWEKTQGSPIPMKGDTEVKDPETLAMLNRIFGASQL